MSGVWIALLTMALHSAADELIAPFCENRTMLLQSSTIDGRVCIRTIWGVWGGCALFLNETVPQPLARRKRLESRLSYATNLDHTFYV